MLSVVMFAVLFGVASSQTTRVQPNDFTALLFMTLQITNKDPTWSQLTPACQWKGITCNADGRVKQIVWYNMNLGGYANLTTLPRGLQQLDLSYNQLTGNPSLTNLPQGLQQLDLDRNQLTGQPFLATLPKGLQQLYLSFNQLTGTPDLATLPQGLQQLDLDSNQLTGTPNLATLPQGLQQLDLSNNKLTGTPDFTTLSQGLQQLSLADNNFSGSGSFVPSLPYPQGWCFAAQQKMCGALDGAYFILECPDCSFFVRLIIFIPNCIMQ